ncbi:hypothetical protein [Phytohabitans kaempferiae]|uniref:Uncharacterized protein n=1 Tax=Phytohabitans kaempferiae TaxID=1620943 RepID=A0ABV6MES4_9ACTN
MGSVWSAIDPQGRSLMVALLDPNVATDQRWREAFQEAANALVQAGEPGYLYADFASGSPWVAYAAENGVGAERVFLALGMDFQPVPPDGLGPLDHAPVEPTTQLTPPAPDQAAAAQQQPLPPDVINTTGPAEAPPTTVIPPVRPGPPAAAQQSPAAPQPTPQSAPPAALPPPQPALPAPAQPVDDYEQTQPTQRMQLPPAAPPQAAPPAQSAPVNPWAPTQSVSGPPQQAMPVSSPPPMFSAPPHPTSGTPHPISGAPHPISGAPHPTSGASGPVSGTPMSPAYSHPQSPAYNAPAYGPRPPHGPAPYDPYAPVPPAQPRRSRTGLWVGIAVAVLLVIAGGGGVYAFTASGGEEPRPPEPSPSATLATAPLPTASPLFPGIEPPREGSWPEQWPKFGASDSLRTLSDLDGLGFTLKVPRAWDCSPAGRAEGFAKYNCGVSPGANPEIGGELIVRTCPDGCSQERRDALRQSEEAFGLQWVRSGEFAAYAESSSLEIEGAKRYGLVIVAYWRSGAEGTVDRQLVFRMTAPVDGAGQLRRVANYIRDTVIF